MRVVTVLVLSLLLLAGCSSSPCDHLTDELCMARGEEDALCQARRAGTDERTRLGDLQCKRALFLYPSEGGGVER